MTYEAPVLRHFTARFAELPSPRASRLLIQGYETTWTFLTG